MEPIQRSVLRWYAREARSFGWRETRDPYAILVSEVMLQQTQTARVAPVYEAFLLRFPTLSTLAAAQPGEVLRAWRGLGYNRRALALHRAAGVIVRDHDGIVPSRIGDLRRLPGVGEYTSHAVACFAFGAGVAVVDTNVRRVLSRAVAGIDATDERTLGETARRFVPPRRAPAWNQALMDIGAKHCRPSTPRCEGCPFFSMCAYRREGARPRARPRRAQERFEGSRRQIRGAVVERLRGTPTGLTVSGLRRRVTGLDDEILTALARDGLVVLSSAARRGSARGRVRLP